MNYAPVAVFVYNREDKARELLTSLSNNVGAEDTDLYIFSDGPRSNNDNVSVAEVRKYIKTVTNFRSIKIIEADKNLGLGQSIINGISMVLDKHERIIVLEDDLVLSPLSLNYFNRLLEHYSENTGVFSISGYSPPETLLTIPEYYEYSIYCIPRMQCWGWATWRDRWEKADLDMTGYNDFINSSSQRKSYIETIGLVSLSVLESYMKGEKDVWACRWVYTHFKYNAVCVCPVRSYIDNTGNDGSAD